MSLLVWCVLGTLLAPAHGPGAVRLPLERDPFERVSVRVRVGAGEYRFLVDTGSTYSSISGRLADRLRLPPAGQVLVAAAGAERVVPLVKPPRLGLGARAVALPWVCVLPPDEDDPLQAYDGVVGQDVLRRFDYVLDRRGGVLWLDPPLSVTRAPGGVRLPLARAAGPLAVTDPASNATWSLDSGASHVVVFREGLARRSGREVDLLSAAGRRRAWGLGPSAIALGAARVTWREAVLADAPGRVERGLLPLALFDSIHVDHRAAVATVVPRGQGRDPDVATRLGALEDHRVVGR
jgi:predicted aspartyl protease